MPPSEFAIELWLEILAYLPPSYILKLMGVNRILFGLALDYKYEELRLLSNDVPTLHSFEQLRHVNIASRVRRLYLRPNFLPGPYEKFETPTPGCFSWLKGSGFSRTSNLRKDLANNVLDMASKSLVNCTRLQEVDIIIYDHIITNPFASLLKTLWVTLGKELQRLSIQTMHNKVPLLLQPIADVHDNMPNLASFELTLMDNREFVTGKEAEETTKSITKFLEAFKPTLSSLSLSSLFGYDLSPLFDGLSEMPALRKLELGFKLCGTTLSNRLSLVQFLSKQHGTLQHLVLDPRPRYEFFFRPQCQLYDFLVREFMEVKLPHVETFQVGSQYLPSTLVPHIMPNLRTLIVRTSEGVSEVNLREIIGSTGGMLESLDISIHDFSTEAFSLLVKGCPRLRRLTVGYSRTSLPPAMQLPDGTWQVAYDSYSSRRYPQWPLEYLRLGLRDECGEIHPRKGITDAVAQTVSPRVVEKDLERRCLCTCSTSNI
ncbi:hypothetical protein BKA70DRAFT_1294134 [Coprinopsis sp. MPI-PUGE-AT-0042]|nr:hypothetical protein BKA70DRAFT_1294134 [Coprinopsis sp. MPI-PUGE-AT-0042]